MQVTWDDRSPIYRQLADRFRDLIIDGVFQNGDSLPSVRQVASEQQINPLTVSKAYQLLVNDGLVEKRRGLGMYVSEGATERLVEDERRGFLDNELPAFRDKAERLGFTLEQLIKEDG